VGEYGRRGGLLQLVSFLLELRRGDIGFLPSIKGERYMEFILSVDLEFTGWWERGVVAREDAKNVYL
jgi:hypothetical protein